MVKMLRRFHDAYYSVVAVVVSLLAMRKVLHLHFHSKQFDKTPKKQYSYQVRCP